MVMKNTMRTSREGTMKTRSVSTAKVAGRVPVAVCTRAAGRGRACGACVDTDPQESFVQELLATFSDRWEW